MIKTLFVSAALAAIATNAPAQDRFMPTASCTQVAGFDDPAEHRAMERYLYFAASTLLGTVLRDEPETYAELRRRTGSVCVELPYGSSVEDAVATLARQISGGPGAASPLEGEARALLQQFLTQRSNAAALTAALKPTPAELAQIFKPPALPRMQAYVDRIFGSGAITPKPGYTEILITLATTSDLIDRKPVLEEFPGGNKELLPHLQRDIPVVRFKFVEPGETLGLAFDGLYKVGDRWVMVPKGWRALEN